MARAIVALAFLAVLVASATAQSSCIINKFDFPPDGDGYFTRPRNGTVAGLCVLLNATGAIIDTQEQGCEECTHQCFYWSECTTMIYNYVVVPRTDALLDYCPLRPIFPGEGPPPKAAPSPPAKAIPLQGRKLLADFDELDAEFTE